MRQSLACIVLLPGFVWCHKHLMQAAWCTADAACLTRKGGKAIGRRSGGLAVRPAESASEDGKPRMVGPLGCRSAPRLHSTAHKWPCSVVSTVFQRHLQPLPQPGGETGIQLWPPQAFEIKK